MTYVSWAALYEGPTDAAYFDVLIPRVMEDVVMKHATRNSDIALSPAVRLRRGSAAEVAVEACQLKEAFNLIFIHADTGGRGIQTNLQARSSAYCADMNAHCAWPPERCVTIVPRHETEAWILADAQAVAQALGYRDPQADWDLPANAVEAEQLSDPKLLLSNVIDLARGRRRTLSVHQLFPAIAQRQNLFRLRMSPSFLEFEGQLRNALENLGCI